MDAKEITKKSKEFVKDKTDKFKALNTTKKIALGVIVIALISATVFGVKYAQDSKYGVLFSGLESKDALSVTQELEAKGVDMKIKGTTIYVPKDQVDKLRIEMSPMITSGSQGFELMDEGSSFGLTDEEFELKKNRMIQGEIERTIKTFPQIENARVHLTQGQESVFADESIEGKAAVYITVKDGEKISEEQVRSIMSLVSAAGLNIPKQSVEVIDQNMNLLSEGLFDENGNAVVGQGGGLDLARNAERSLNKDLERSIKGLLEPIFGVGKISVTVNSDLNFDTTETTQIVVDPNRVAILEERSENTSKEPNESGGTIDNNMSVQAVETQNGEEQTKEEHLEFSTGQTETKTIKAQGEINRITASIAINAEVDAGTMRDIEQMVENAVGMDAERGDSVSVVAMNFTPVDLEDEQLAQAEAQRKKKMLVAGVVTVVLIALGAGAMFMMKKKKKQEELSEDEELDYINQQIEQMEGKFATGEDDAEGISLEEEVKQFSAENPEQVTEIINKWLND